MPVSTNKRNGKNKSAPKTAKSVNVITEEDTYTKLTRIADLMISNTNSYVGREHHAGVISEALRNEDERQVVYAYGPPGTGKTTLIDRMCTKSNFQTHYINCSSMATTSLQEALIRITLALGLNISDVQTQLNGAQMAKMIDTVEGFRTLMDVWYKLLQRVDRNDEEEDVPHVLVMDEIETLSMQSSKQVSLSDVFIKYGLNKNSRFRIMAIGNDLEFITKIPTKYISKQARKQLLPLEFHYYTLEEAIDIMNSRIPERDTITLEKVGLTRSKLELVIRKGFASHSGDVRRLIDLTHTMVKNCAIPPAKSTEGSQIEDQLRWMEAFKKVNKQLGTTNMGSFTTRMSTLPWQSQVVLYAIVNEYSKELKEMTLERACDCYHRLCTRLKAPIIEDHAVYRMMEDLQTQGLVVITRRGNELSTQGTPLRRPVSAPKNRSFRTPLKNQLMKLKNQQTTSAVRSQSAVFIYPSVGEAELEHIVQNREGLAQRIVSMVIDR